MKVALFPGQSLAASDVLEHLRRDDPIVAAASDQLGYDLVRKVEKIARSAARRFDTSLAQPAIFVASVASWARARDTGESFDYLAGHSLGEYAALVAGEAFSFEDALRAVAVRAAAMRDAARARPGGMVALLGLDRDQVTQIAASTGTVVANDNCPGQMVLSGSEDQLAAAGSEARSLRGRAVLLGVSGPFHTEAMRGAAPALQESLLRMAVRSPRIPVISNVTARPYRSPGEIRHLLVEQMCAPVRFRESLEWLWDQGARTFSDLGPGKVVEGLATRTVRTLTSLQGASVV